MLKFLFWGLIFHQSLYAQEISFTWLGTTGSYITDGKTGLLFDPVVTRPSLTQVMFYRPISSDQKLVQEWIDKIQMKNVSAVFISHSHYDHAFDAAAFTKTLGATLYGTKTTYYIGKGGDVPEEKLKVIQAEEVYTVGAFKVTVLPSDHTPLIGSYQAFPGELKEPLRQPAPASAYVMGGAFGFYIEHAKGNIFFLPMSTRSEKLHFNERHADVVLQGIASRKSTKDLLKELSLPAKPKTIIPLHFDDFSYPLAEGFRALFSVDPDEFVSTTKKLYPELQVTVPKHGEKIILYR
ncbi:MAG: MBL fold metallo-hydrolase [Bacteriovoracaceae bacterium]|nr:MBL fold metallo-hydrolase [Bacteriovoracaceae bacterium]